VLHGVYPERRPPSASLVQRLTAHLDAIEIDIGLRAERRFVAAVRSNGPRLQSLADTAFSLEVKATRRELGAEGFHALAMVRACACACEAMRRALGKTPFDTQIRAARLMLQSRAVEMRTGEGKTLAIGLAAAIAGMAGIPVHCVTANDYLVYRDAELLRQTYALLGLSVASVTAQSTPAERRAAYRCDIAYCTAKDLVFDYLRDRMAGRGTRGDPRRRARHLMRDDSPAEELLLRGLCMAIVDEADSVLIDDARTPLVLAESVPSAMDQSITTPAIAFACTLRRDVDFAIHGAQPSLMPDGTARLQEWARSAGPTWKSERRAKEIILMALCALHLFERDRHYVVRDGKIQMIEQSTGRLMPDRSWSRGLHQLIEQKEGCTASREQQPIAQMTFQRFFPRYLMLTGTSATLMEARSELRSVYALRVARIAPRLPGRRRLFAPRIYAESATKWDQVVQRIAQIHMTGQPLLIGTESVRDSDALAASLQRRGITHQLLNARQDQEEARIVAQAGQRGAITIATNMAGRGTDIALGEGVSALGGLHVICCLLNSSQRIDRQLQGRSARQGDPGSVDILVALDERLIKSWIPSWGLRAICVINDAKSPIPTWIAHILIRLCQWLEERRERLARAQLIRRDQAMESNLTLGGPGE
jgi:preprotein translocase subunit SecA